MLRVLIHKMIQKPRLIKYIPIYSEIYWKLKSFLQFDDHAPNIENR